MKVDSSKSEGRIENDKQSKPIKSGDQLSLFNNDKTTNSQKDFATVLKKATEQKENLFYNKNLNKTSENEKPQKENETKSTITNKTKEKTLEEKQQNSHKDDSSLDSNQDKSSGYIQIVSQTNIEEIKYPNVRTIVHVADLERIIASIRSQTFANGKQVTIELKRSVFQGLELKLVIDKNRNVIAEFITANENVRNQLNEKAEELTGLLKDRGVKLSELKMSLISDSNAGNQSNSEKNNKALSVGQSTSSNITTESKDLENNDQYGDSDTSYQA